MKILFQTKYKNSISTLINLPNLSRLNDIEEITFSAFQDNYEDFDIVLFMGYDPNVSKAKKINPDIKVGIIDIRPDQIEECLGADFVVANGIEMSDWLSNYFANIYCYPIYEELDIIPKEHKERDDIAIGYHGNKVHFQSCVPYLFPALEELSKEIPLKLIITYNVESLGKCILPDTTKTNLKVEYVQWHPAVYKKELYSADIGIVPNILPIKNKNQVNQKIAINPLHLKEENSDYLIRYKKTSNAGRIYTFAQMGVPVIADIYPSACELIKNDYSGLLAHSTGGWYRALRRLSLSYKLRNKISRNLNTVVKNHYSIKALNNEFFEFLKSIVDQRATKTPTRFKDQDPDFSVFEGVKSKKGTLEAFTDRIRNVLYKQYVKYLK